MAGLINRSDITLGKPLQHEGYAGSLLWRGQQVYMAGHQHAGVHAAVISGGGLCRQFQVQPESAGEKNQAAPSRPRWMMCRGRRGMEEMAESISGKNVL